MHHRRTKAATTTSSSKVSASRERRARRKLDGGATNGCHGDGGGKGYGARVVLLAVGSIVLGAVILWGGALHRVTTTTEAESDGDKGGNRVLSQLGKFPLPKGMKRLRNSKIHKPPPNDADIVTDIIKDDNTNNNNNNNNNNDNPYNPAALAKNPHLGWQPPLLPSPLGYSFSWRVCFRADAKNDGSAQPVGCRENPDEFGTAPPPPLNFVTDSGEKIWVPDVTMVRTMLLHGMDIDGNVFPPPLDEELCQDIGVTGGKSGDSNKECVREANIRATGPLNATTVTISPSNHYGESIVDGEAIVVPAPRIMCLVYTMADAHGNRIRAMRDTWAGGCDGFLAFSTQSDPRLPTISLEHEGPESYDNMWQKVRSIWRFVGTHYLEDFDWFFIGGDDLFVMPHNLKTYLASLVYKDGTDPVTKEYFVGRRFNAGGNDYFNSGGAGYTLSRATLRRFLENMDDATHCAAHRQTSMEDVMIANCLRHLGIHFTDTRDAKGRERFHPFAPGTHLHWKPPGPGQPRDWYEEYNREWGILQGKDCCAPDSVSFHYVKKASMVRHMHALLNFCDLNK